MSTQLKQSPADSIDASCPTIGTPDVAPCSSPAIYRVGTLQYTTRGLVVLFIWLLWGDFCFSLFESIFSRFMPLYLKEFQASDTTIGLLTGSIGGAVNILFLPSISMWSDRYRSRWGRRIPFLFWVTPCTVLSLMLIGMAPEIAAWIQTLSTPLRNFSAISVTLALLSVFTIAWHFFNMILVNMFRFLFKDVVPDEVVPRFFAYVQIVATAGNFVFLWYVFPHMLTHRKWICGGIGIFYLVAFYLMCWRVKEGSYPAIPPRIRKPFMNEYIKSFATYFRDCLSIAIYRNFVIVFVLVITATSATSPFSLLFVSESIHVSMGAMGAVFAWTSVASGVLMLPMGYLCGRINPFLLSLVSLATLAIGPLFAYSLVHDQATWMVYSLIMVVPNVGWTLAINVMQIQLFPAAKFGQYFSSINVIGFGSIFIGNYLVGRFMDYMNSDYRMTFLISSGGLAAAIFPMFLVYLGWQRHGGPHHYVAPLPKE